MYCPKCGSKIADGSDFCIVCGAEQSGNMRPQSARNNPQSAHRNMVPEPQVNVKLSVSTGIVIVFSMIMLLTIFTTPVLILENVGLTYSNSNYSIGLIGEKLQTFRIMLVFIAACTMLGAFFKIISQNELCIFCQAVSSAILSWQSIWLIAAPTVGFYTCLICAVVIIICNLYETNQKYSRKRYRR